MSQSEKIHIVGIGENEAERVIRMIRHGLRRFAQGVFMLWYPVKADGLEKVLAEQVQAMGIASTLRVELMVREAFDAVSEEAPAEVGAFIERLVAGGFVGYGEDEAPV